MIKFSPNTPAAGYQQYVKAQRHRFRGAATYTAIVMHSIGILIMHARYLYAQRAGTSVRKILVIVNNACNVTCSKRIYGHRQGSSGSKQVQTNQPILSAVQVDVQIVLGVLNQFSCKKQSRESDQDCSPATRLYMAMLNVAVLMTSSSLMSRLRLLSSSMLMYSSVSWMYSAALIKVRYWLARACSFQNMKEVMNSAED